MTKLQRVQPEDAIAQPVDGIDDTTNYHEPVDPKKPWQDFINEKGDECVRVFLSRGVVLEFTEPTSRQFIAAQKQVKDLQRESLDFSLRLASACVIKHCNFPDVPANGLPGYQQFVSLKIKDSVTISQAIGSFLGESQE